MITKARRSARFARVRCSLRAVYLSAASLSACCSLGWAAPADATPRYVERALSQGERAALLSTLRPLVATISRRPTFPAGVRPIGEQETLGRGLWLTPELILTAEAWLERAPLEQGVSFELRDVPKRAQAQRALTVLYRSPQTGLALLHLITDRGDTARAELLKAAHAALSQLAERQPRELTAPRTLWALTDAPHKVSPVMLTGRGLGAEAYYWKLSAPMRWGDPMFNADGLWVGAACAQGRLLPVEALRDFLRELL